MEIDKNITLQDRLYYMKFNFNSYIEHQCLKASQYLNGSFYCLVMNGLSKSSIKYRFENMNYFVEEGSTRHYFIKPRGDRYRKGLKFIAEKVMKSYSICGLPINKNDLVVDVGANNGDLILGLPMCRYTAFEPAPIEFALLAKINSLMLKYII